MGVLKLYFAILHNQSKSYNMPKISFKGLSMPDSPIRKLVPYAEAAKKRDVKVFHLNIGQPDIKTPQVALDAVKNNTVEVLAYSRSEGSDAYREKLAAYYAKNNIKVNADQIIVTTGGSEALIITMKHYRPWRRNYYSRAFLRQL